MFAFFESLVDPYTPYRENDTPTNRVGPFLGLMLRPFRKLIALNLMTSAATAVAEVALIFYLGRLIDILTGATPDEFWSLYGLELAIVLFLVLVLKPIVETLDTALIKNAIQPNVAALGRWRSYRHVLRQPTGWFESDFAGRIANRVVQMPAAMGDLVFLTMNSISYTVAYMVGAATLLASANPWLLVPIGLWLILYGLLLRWSLKRVRPAARASSAARSKTLGFVVDSYSNIQSVKLFSHTDRETEFAVGILENHRKTYMAENRIVTAMDAGLVILNGVLIVSVIGWALVIWTNGAASVGVVASAGALALRIAGMTGMILSALSNFFRALGVIAEGMETVAQPIGLPDVEDAKALAVTGGEITVRGLTHHYGRETGGLNNVDIHIKSGERVGIVGRSGAGKSTLVKALLRLYDPEEGAILIDGNDLRAISQESLRAQIGMVQQETSLLHRSIRENILYGRPDATEAEVLAAADRANATEFIAELNDTIGNTGFDAQVGERGVKLSGGQRQRIALARVILKNAPILILDEATSALDSETEAQIQQTLYRMMEGKTVVAIAHRLSTIAQMDRIIVLDEGRVVEEGTHDALIAQDGHYASFWKLQSGGFLSL